jgi:hypothetical protein
MTLYWQLVRQYEAAGASLAFAMLFAATELREQGYAAPSSTERTPDTLSDRRG